MIFLLALIPATALTVAGYVALFLSHRSEGALKSFGHYLGIWAFVLAGLVVLGGMFAAGHLRAAHAGMWDHPGGMHCPWMERREGERLWERGERGESGAAPANPAAPPPAAPAPSPAPPAPKG